MICVSVLGLYMEVVRVNHVPAGARLAALSAKGLRLSVLLVVSANVISLGKIPGQIQLTRTFILMKISASVRETHNHHSPISITVAG